jgi:Fe-S cluster biogenesis protein NfuA
MEPLRKPKYGYDTIAERQRRLRRNAHAALLQAKTDPYLVSTNEAITLLELNVPPGRFILGVDRQELIESVGPAEVKRSMTDQDRDALLERIEGVLDEHIRPGLRADGGDVDVVGVDADRIVQVRMTGACQGCPSAIMTLVFGIESALKARIPEIRFLEAVP